MFSFKSPIIIISFLFILSLFSYGFFNFGSQYIIQNGATYQFAKKTPDGYKCMIRYQDKDSKESPKSTIFHSYEEKTSSTCPSNSKVIEITKDEMLKLVQIRLNDQNFNVNPRIILPANE
jgi:hypothetical protein